MSCADFYYLFFSRLMRLDPWVIEAQSGPFCEWQEQICWGLPWNSSWGCLWTGRGLDMWNLDASAAAGIIWSWWTHSRTLASQTALLSSTRRPFQVEPLLRGCGCMYPAAIFAFLFFFSPRLLYFCLSSLFICGRTLYFFFLFSCLAHKRNIHIPPFQSQ